MLFLIDVDHGSFEKAKETRQINLQAATVSLQVVISLCKRKETAALKLSFKNVPNAFKPLYILNLSNILVLSITFVQERIAFVLSEDIRFQLFGAFLKDNFRAAVSLRLHKLMTTCRDTVAAWRLICRVSFAFSKLP